MLLEVDQLDYNQLRASGAQKVGTGADTEGARPIAGQLKTDLLRLKKAGAENQSLIDVFDGKDEEEKDNMVLKQLGNWEVSLADAL